MFYKYRVPVAALVLAALLTACGEKTPPPRTAAALPVSVVKVEPRSLTLSTQLPGRTAPLRIAEIRPQVNGLIRRRLFTEGADVKAGQVLYEIDPAPFQAALNSAQAGLQRSEASRLSINARAARVKALLADKAVSQQDHDDADAALKQVDAEIASWKAQVETARINLGYTKVTAPISGRIGKSSVTDGALVTAYQPVALATIQQLDPIYVDVTQSTSDLLRLRQRFESGNLRAPGADLDKVRLILEDDSEYAEEGALQFRDVSVDPSTGSVTLRMVFPNPNGILLPEMFVRAVITEGASTQAICVPQQGVLRNAKGDPYAYVVGEGGKVEMRPLKLERAIKDEWLISDGLKAGDQIIVEGVQTLQMLRPGTPVTVKAEPFDPSAGAAPMPKAPAAPAPAAK
ncbi:MAG: efflux RND transporter periplasmic adaptor subunit [Candidatus Accumulibacter sp.]|jgi:membrane fusion protein (multidrug efflux system)|nr:efflux RND transporter periplasmic adaptor subunit [Accumulibacter sp.]